MKSSLNEDSLKFSLNEDSLTQPLEPDSFLQLQEDQEQLSYEKSIKPSRIALLVAMEVEAEEARRKLEMKRTKAYDKHFKGLANVFEVEINGVEIFMITFKKDVKLDKSQVGYAIASAVCALVSEIFKPDILLNFGTAGGVCSDKIKYGSVGYSWRGFYIDRFRHEKTSHVLWATRGSGQYMKVICEGLGLSETRIGSHNNFEFIEEELNIIKALNITYVDMEAAPLSEVARLLKIPILFLKVLSDDINLHKKDPALARQEYEKNKALVSRKGTEALLKVIGFMTENVVKIEYLDLDVEKFESMFEMQITE